MAHKIGCDEIKLASDDEEEPKRSNDPRVESKKDQLAGRGPPQWRLWKIDPDWKEEDALSNEKYPINFGTIPASGPIPREQPERTLNSENRITGSETSSDERVLDDESILFVRHYNDDTKLTEFPRHHARRGANRWQEVHISDDEDDDEDEITLMDLDDSQFDDFYLHVGSFHHDKEEKQKEEEKLKEDEVDAESAE
jgi:hypothetical protein